MIAFTTFVLFPTACVNGTDCDLVGCEQGLSVSFVHPYADAGTYTITITVDSARSTCSVVLPPQEEPGRLCDHDDVGLHLGFADAGPSTRSIIGVGIASTNAKTVAIRVVKDGAELANASFSPAYVKSGCNDQCTSAKKDLP